MQSYCHTADTTAQVADVNSRRYFSFADNLITKQNNNKSNIKDWEEQHSEFESNKFHVLSADIIMLTRFSEGQVQ